MWKIKVVAMSNSQYSSIMMVLFQIASQTARSTTSTVICAIASIIFAIFALITFIKGE